LKIFKRKIKRSKKKSDDASDEDSDEEYDDSDYDSDESFDDDEEDDSCPPGCDQTLYDKVLELREKRLDQEEILSDFQKAIDDLKKANERQHGRERQIDKDLKGTEVEIEVFQTEKQKKLNDLDISIIMKLNQIVCLVSAGNGKIPVEEDEEEASSPPTILPDSISASLFFGRPQLYRLRSRIGELANENKSLRMHFKNLHKEHRRLGRDKQRKTSDIEAAEIRCEELQMLKFGQVIDLESLDKQSISKTVTDLEDKTRMLESKNEAAISRMKNRISKAQEHLLLATRENTQKLEKIASLTHQQYSLEKELNNTTGGSGAADQEPALKKEVEERNRLVQLVKLQAKEVDALKAEINMLRRKGGHVYTPAVRHNGPAAAPSHDGKVGEALSHDFF
jgi:chromosome segregation ATPase